MRLAALVCAAVLSACSGTGCGGARGGDRVSELPEDQLLVWSASQGLWGSETLTVFRDGRVTYMFQPAGPDGEPSAGETRLDESELARIVTTLEDEDACDISMDRDGVPDEAVPVLRVRAGELDCRVEAWDGEWDENAPKITALVRELSVRARR